MVRACILGYIFDFCRACCGIKLILLGCHIKYIEYSNIIICTVDSVPDEIPLVKESKETAEKFGKMISREKRKVDRKYLHPLYYFVFSYFHGKHKTF